MAERHYTLECADHGSMERDEPRSGWRCITGDCTAWVPDHEVHRLVAGAPATSPDPLPIVIT